MARQWRDVGRQSSCVTRRSRRCPSRFFRSGVTAAVGGGVRAGDDCPRRGGARAPEDRWSPERGDRVESDFRGHAHRHQHAQFVEPAPRRNRSHRDLRRLQRHRTALHADLRSYRRAARRIATGRCDRCRLHDACRLVPGASGGARRAVCGLAGRAWWRGTAVNRAIEASNGEPKSRRRFWHGARPTGSARRIRRLLAAPRLASGGRRRRPSDR